jgi:hypothetical protein
MFPMQRKSPPVVVEYDCRGKRVSKRFADAYEARRFYAAKLRQGNRPAVKRPKE